MSCNCADYKDIELDRKSISVRIKESKVLKKQLNLIAKHKVEYKLYQCPICGQMWQGSHAWNWGNDEYVFKVPLIAISDWQDNTYISPDEMLIFSAVMQNYLSKNDFKITERKCIVDSCNEKAVEFSVHCKNHHIEHLQQTHSLPEKPKGRLFLPYYYEGFDV